MQCMDLTRQAIPHPPPPSLSSLPITASFFCLLCMLHEELQFVKDNTRTARVGGRVGSRVAAEEEGQKFLKGPNN